MTIRDHIASIVAAGGSVTFPYKENPEDWFVDAKLCSAIDPLDSGLNRVYACCGPEVFIGARFDSPETAIERYCEVVFSRRNLGLAWQGIERHKLTDRRLEYLDRVRLRRLENKYWTKYFPLDYPEFVAQVAAE